MRINLFYIFLILKAVYSNNLIAADDPTTILKNSLQKQNSNIVDYTSGCSICVKEQLSRPKFNFESPVTKKPVEMSVVTLADLDNLYNDLKKNSNIPWDVEFEGSAAKSYLASEYLEKKGIISGKIMLEGKLVPNLRNFEQVLWNMSVANVLLVEVSGKKVPYVLDPSLCDGPVTLKEWKDKHFSRKAAMIKTEVLVNRFHYDISTANQDLKVKDPNYLKIAQEVDKDFKEWLKDYYASNNYDKANFKAELYHNLLENL